MKTLNLGILAHVDAGKTTLTERLLHAAGVIDEVGRVDDGTTQTDTLALERQRGITIRSAVASFVVDGATINLVDTPGHPDFIAEVERVLGVLDGAVLVVSAVEGVQSQTVLLHRALRRLGVPTLAFVNKIDRVGADVAATLDDIADRLAVVPVAMGTADGVGSRGARTSLNDLGDHAVADGVTEVLAANDDEVLQRFLAGTRLSVVELHRELADQTRRGRVMPVLFGAALTGVGVDELMDAIPLLLPPVDASSAGPPSGMVFKIERGPTGEKIAFVRLVAGTMRTRDRVALGGDGSDPDTVTSIEVFAGGSIEWRADARAGEIAKVHGLAGARVGTTFGPHAPAGMHRVFVPPALETAVVPRDPSQMGAVFEAVTELAEQDPLINLRQDDTRHELFLSLYGEVQKEIIAQMLSADHGLEIEFRPTTPVCIERPNGAGAAIEHLPRRRSPAHPLLATVGLEVSPLPAGSGVEFELAVGIKQIPIHVFDTVGAFRNVMDRAVRDTLRQGLHGWQVTDCRVVMTASDYQAPPRKWPGTTSSDYRLLTPLVVMAALRDCGTTVLEPVVEFRLEIPPRDLGPVMAVLRELDAHPGASSVRGATTVLHGRLRLARLHQLQTRLPDLTRGEGVLETESAGYAPVIGEPPSRPRTGRNPLDRETYLRNVAR